MKKYLVTTTLILVCCFAFAQKETTLRSRIDLKGEWEFQTDPVTDLKTAKLKDKILLPGTMDGNKKGKINKDTTTYHLNRRYYYEGKAWYRKKIVIPASYKDKHIQLFLERTKHTDIWIDDTPVGSSVLLQTPQLFDLTKYLSPGEHYLTICINNTLALTPYGNVHIYSDDTETNWNGIIGQIYLEATSPEFIGDLQVYPDIDQNSFEAKLKLQRFELGKEITVELQPEISVGGKIRKLKAKQMKFISQENITMNYEFDSAALMWDEYHPNIYTLTATITTGSGRDSKSVRFGMRKFSKKGTQFAINDRTIFLRGKNDACVFPLTGYPPMNAEGWERIFRIAKSYGINHYRYHSWCPPEAAFAAADKLGIFMQVELPFWGGVDNDELATSLLNEGLAMLKYYANHPSFVLLSHGNEIWAGHDRVEQNLVQLKQYDSRPMYTMGSNVNIGYKSPTASTDFFVGARTPSAGDTTRTHTRLTHAFADSRDGGLLNTTYPNTDFDFSYPVSQMSMPLLSHEIGQYQIFPDYSEILKYKGVLEARNLMVFKNRLTRAGMGNMDKVFQKASGAWSAICYKAEMEAAIRTKGMAGFQLLDLQDFPGQGTALVGILDAFMDSKNVITRNEWIQSCNDVVLLGAIPKFCWSNTEAFKAVINVANYSGRYWKEQVKWEIKDAGNVLAKGVLTKNDFKPGTLNAAGEISFNLSGIKKASKLQLVIYLSNSTYRNDYPIWVYPKQEVLATKSNEIITGSLNNDVISQLENGASVLYFAGGDSIPGKTIEGLFPPEFWNWGMFKSISESNHKKISPGTLGILTNPTHPLFKSFPTDAYTNWQWYTIIKNSRPLILDNLNKSFKPIVQVIDNLERNHKLGLVMEFGVGKGKLLVCMVNKDKIMDTPEGKAFYNALVGYLKTMQTRPAMTISRGQLSQMLSAN